MLNANQPSTTCGILVGFGNPLPQWLTKLSLKLLSLPNWIDVIVYYMEPIILALLSAKIAELRCTDHHQCGETGSYIPHSGWAAFLLLINQRINYNVYKELNGLTPAYLSDLLIPYKTRKNLRSAGKRVLDTPCTFSKTAKSAIDHSCLRRQDSGTTRGYPDFHIPIFSRPTSRPTYFCGSFIYGLICPLLGLP